MNETKDTLKPTLSKRVTGIIWKILIDEKKHVLAVESRDPENKQVYFSVFDYKSGSVFLKNFILSERWNLNMVHLTGESLLIKVFPDEGSPVSKGIICFNFKTANVNWEKYNITYHSVWQEGLEVYNPDLLPRRSFFLDRETGIQINPDDCTPEITSIIFPDVYGRNIIPDWLSHKEITGGIFHQKICGRDILAFHEKNDTEICLRLLVYQDDAVLINEILAQGIQKLLPEAFFIVQSHLFCIKGNNTIISYLV